MVSLKDIAAACGVSIATVSKALSDHRDISEATKKRVREKAEQLGYSPNQSARYLKTNRSYNIGVLCEDAGGDGLKHDFFAGILESLKKTAESKGYDVTFLNNTYTNMSFVERSRFRGFDGIALACSEFSDPRIQELLSSNLNVVTIDYLTNNKTAIMSDNTDGMNTLMSYLNQCGHKKIAYIYGNGGNVTRQRLAAYYRNMEDFGLMVPDGYVRQTQYRNVQECYEITLDLLDMPERPTCIIYPDDVAALGGINAIHERKLRIPEDISIAGYDGIRQLQYIEPKLTTIWQNVDEMGRLAAMHLINAVEKPMTTAAEIEVVKGKLLEGQTVKNLTRKE